MVKEGNRSFLFDSQGRINLALILSLVFMFVMMMWVASAVSILIKAPGNMTYNGTGTGNQLRNINFTFNVTWSNDAENVSNCSIYVNNTAANTGLWDSVVNFTPGNTSADATVVNSSLSYANFTFSSDGNFTFNIGCFDSNHSQTVRNFTGGIGGSGNRSLFIDTVAPQVSPILPWGTWVDGGVHNITSYQNATLYINVTDNSTKSVFLVLFDKDSTIASRASSASGSTNESANRTMTLNATLLHDKSVYRFNLSGLFNLTNNFTGPGAKSVVFCANDSLDRLTCSAKKDILISGTNITKMIESFNDVGYNNPDSADSSSAAFSFSQINVTYGNGTELPTDAFIDPLSLNLTLIINFTNATRTKIFVVGARVDEAQLGNMSRVNFSNTMTNQVQQELGSGFKSNFTFIDIASFIPNAVSYEYAILQFPDKFNRKMYCNGTSITSPGCFEIFQCNGTAIGLFNSSSVIPQASACWIDNGGYGLGGKSSSTFQLLSGFTYIFVDHFSGGLGGNDRSQPNVTMNTPAVSITNVSSSLTQAISFTLDDVNSTGFNLSSNTSINFTITQGGTVIKQFMYINNSASNLTCTTSDPSPPSAENATSVTCNATYTFNSNSSYLIQINGSDSSNNSNPVSAGTNSFTVIVDQIAPRLYNLSIYNSSATDTNNGTLGSIEGPTSVPTTDKSWAQGRKFYAFANFTDNLTRPFQASLQFFNESANSNSGAWQIINTTTDYTDINITRSMTSINATANFSFFVPTGHNEFEGRNVSFRIIANDTLGNINSSMSVKNITININDTTMPSVSINGTFSVNGSNITTTTPTIGFVVNEPHALSFINISIDSNQTINNAQGKDTLCQKAAFYDTSAGAGINVESNRNNSITVASDTDCPLINGKHNVSVTAKDQWGNTNIYHFDFNVQSATQPGFSFNLTYAQGVGTWSKAATVNNSNITSSVGITLFEPTPAVGANVDKFRYTSSCDSTGVVVTNKTIIYPFNGTCATASANRTLTVTINDTAGNSNTTVLGFLVDNVAPTLTVNEPTNGQTFTNTEARFNLSVLDDNQGIASLGYYLDGSNNPITFNLSNVGSIIAAGATITQTNTTNLTGTHTIKFTANDSVGNRVNSSVLTFTMVGPIDFRGATSTINATNVGNASNVTFVTLGGVTLLTSDVEVNQTLKLVAILNESAVMGANLTITFNGSAANWNKTDKIRFIVNDSTIANGVIGNLTAKAMQSVWVNGSSQFLLDNNSYYGMVALGINVSNASTLGGQLKLYYFADESNLAAQTNITECSVGFVPTITMTLSEGTFPCWNNTNNRTINIFVPHFSVVVFANDSNAPTINVTEPAGSLQERGNQTVSMFVPNITVSPDAVSCKFIVNGSTVNETMVKSGNICLGSTQRFKNLQNANAYNINFTVEDSSGNINNYVVNFNVTDNTNPNTPNSSRVSTSVSTTTTTITISNINESVNATIYYGAVAGVLSSSAVQTDFNQTQAISLSGLTASTTYYFNVTVCDYNGNCQINGTFNLTTSAAASTSSSTSSSSSSGGGGATPTATDVAASKAQVWGAIAAGASVSLDVNKDTIAITSVAVNDVKSALSNVELEVAALTKNPVSTEAAAKVYQYLRINKKNIADSDAGSFKITFKVPNSWLTENSLAAGDVALYRFADSQWKELAAKVTGTDATYTNYEADTPGFSSFAVGVKSSVKVEEKATEDIKAPEETQKEEAAPPTPVEKPKPVEAPAKAPTAWIIAAVVVILGIVLIVMYQKKKQQG